MIKNKELLKKSLLFSIFAIFLACSNSDENSIFVTKDKLEGQWFETSDLKLAYLGDYENYICVGEILELNSNGTAQLKSYIPAVIDSQCELTVSPYYEEWYIEAGNIIHLVSIFKTEIDDPGTKIIIKARILEYSKNNLQLEFISSGKTRRNYIR